ncbi:hypothetical protein J2X31_001675 [Flavobacterium arsenatis]|uniref:FemAB family protein n=1 Tax=Flavobacterium arsenatis TaxID=1484332 RepID=A0ABU1TNX0_9FLAO|nr:FemAB family protein [Flavobacterium arsenatis]MDR6967663.1 hypothetical protein [Flavobacterium arsenatis]
MKNYTVRPYESKDFESWNAFISNAKNATFLFHRDFMDYHKDRFQDFSLIVEEDKKWVAVLPANRIEDTLFSHQGLTYGGLVYDDKLNAEEVETVFNNLILFLKENNFKTIFYKPIISIYSKKSSLEIDYILFQKKAVLYRKDLNLAIDFRTELKISKSKMKHFRRISEMDIEIRKENSFASFWDRVLVPRLQEKHDTNPVHTKEEIQLLGDRFPENIIQYNAYFEDEIVAGITLFHFGNVVKSQYGATTLQGEKIRALDFLFINLINEFKDKVSFFDMGTVTENNEKGYNTGLLKQKEELGCSVYNQDFYSLSL